MNGSVVPPKSPLVLKTKTQWRQAGRGIKPNASPEGYLPPFKGRPVPLYDIRQTTCHSEYVAARNFLVDLFVGYPDRFGFTTPDGVIKTFKSDWLFGSTKDLIASGFDYKKAANGIKVVTHKNLAESFHVAGGKETTWCVIDLDNHNPTTSSTKAHLDLLRRLHESLPQLENKINLKSTFYQYRQIEPTGIQLWIVCNQVYDTSHLHDQVRRHLLTLGDDLDRNLKINGLPCLKNIEILPTSHLVSMIGCYGKEAFTTRKLKIINKRFDCVSLHQHINNKIKCGNVYDRYSELVYVRKMNDGGFSDSNLSNPTRLIINNLPEPPSGKLSWTDLKTIALHGVLSPDDLHDKYLEPLAQALYFREFINIPHRKILIFNYLHNWLLKKHNNFVSRILSGDICLVDSQIQSTIETVIRRTPVGIQNHYKRMTAMDMKFPDKKEILAPLMEADPNTLPLLLIDCKGGISNEEENKKEQKNKPLPSTKILTKEINKKIKEYCESNTRSGKARERMTKFIKLVIAEIGTEGKKFINEQRLHELAGHHQPDKDNSYLKRWKQHLVKAGVMKSGWSKKIIRNKRPSLYELTPWVVESLRASNKPIEGRKEEKGNETP